MRSNFMRLNPVTQGHEVCKEAVEATLELPLAPGTLTLPTASVPPPEVVIVSILLLTSKILTGGSASVPMQVSPGPGMRARYGSII